MDQQNTYQPQGKLEDKPSSTRAQQALIHPDEISVPFAIVSREDGVVVYANDEFRKIIKATKVGKPIAGFLHTDRKRHVVDKELEVKAKCVNTFDAPLFSLQFIITKGQFLDNEHYFVTLDKKEKDKQEKNKQEEAQQEKTKEGNKHSYLPRTEFISHLSEVFENGQTQEGELCMCSIDIDHFSVVNEKYGYESGDYILDQLANLIVENTRIKHALGRLGDNEFGLLLHNIDIDDALQLCELIREQAKTQAFAWEDETISITVSIGIIAIEPGEQEIEKVLAQSTLALSAAKENGRDCVHSSATQDTMMAYHSGKMHYAMVIEDALQNDKFELFAQPIVSLEDTNTHYSYEVLLRIYDHTKQEFVSSQELITAAESLEVTTRIDRWVCEKVFEILSDKIDKEVRIPNISINLSGHSIVSVAFERFLLELTEKYNVPTSCICFEITESVAVKSITRAQNFIRNLKQQGYNFSLDDFGVGYCSFNYLNKLDVDNVKIDGSFVSAMLDDATQFATVQAITNVARTMNIKTIAEFVEKPEVIKALKVIGVDFGQGYIFGKPSSMQDIF